MVEAGLSDLTLLFPLHCFSFPTLSATSSNGQSSHQTHVIPGPNTEQILMCTYNTVLPVSRAHLCF